MTALFEFLIYIIISKLSEIPMEKINRHTPIPLRLQEDIITRVIASTGVYLPFSGETELTVGQIVEEVKKNLAKK